MATCALRVGGLGGLAVARLPSLDLGLHMIWCLVPFMLGRCLAPRLCNPDDDTCDGVSVESDFDMEGVWGDIDVDGDGDLMSM